MTIPEGLLADERTLAAVDFPAIRVWLAQLTASERGAALASALVPQADWRRAELLSAATAEMRTLIAGGFAIDHMPDPGDAVNRARRNVRLRADELGALGRAIFVADSAVRRVRNAESPTLEAMTEGVRSMRLLGEELVKSLGPQGDILDDASPELRRIRRAILNAVDSARARATAIASSGRFAKALQESLVTQRDDRFVVPVKAEFLSQVPGIVHDSSASGQTLFVEPLGVVEENNRVRTLQLEEQHEIERILQRLSERVADEAASIMHLLAIGTELDLAYARARLANEMDARPVRYVDEPRLALHEMRHPLLGSRAVPQSLELGEDRRLLIISGPNMGGKTVSLKLVALSVLMAACGLHLPSSEQSEIGAFKSVLADIGDAQSLAANTSTFAAHLRRLREILQAASPGLLFVIDEIAGGTEAAAGAALAVAILDHLLDAGARGIVTTHAQELKVYAQSRPEIRNAGMRFAPNTHEPTFELDIGVPGRSLALDLARREGYDEAILARARSMIGENERRYDEALAELSEARMELSRAQRAVREEREQQARVRGELERERAAFQAERAEFADRAERRLREVLSEFDEELRKRAPQDLRRAGRSQTALLANYAAGVRKAMAPGTHPQALPADQPLETGMRVSVNGFESEAVVLEIAGDRITVSIGSMRMTVKRGDIQARRKPAADTPKRGGPPPVRRRDEDEDETSLAPIQYAAMEIDVRGKRFHEAQPIVERWIEQAILAGVSPIRLIHGKGTGALGQGLQQALREHPEVRAFRFGNENEGGGGVTMIEL